MSETRARPPLAHDDGVAVIGLGKMGLPMARNLRDRGFRVVGHDVSEASRDRARDEGLAVAASPAQAMAASRLAVVVVGFDDQVLDVVLGSEGLLTGCSGGETIAVCSSVEPRTVLLVEHSATDLGVAVVDTPVCRGEPAAEDASLLVLCGGAQDDLDHVQPALEAVGSDVCRLGGVGAGQVGKMINNYLLWSSVVADHEAMRLGARLGLDHAALRECLLLSSGANWALETWTRARPMPWAEEDMRVLLQYADQVGLAVPTAGVVREEIKRIKIAKAAWTDGGGTASSMDAFTRAHP